jgi:hypothetical protein
MTPELAKVALAFLERDIPLVPREINAYKAVHKALLAIVQPPKDSPDNGEDSPPVS